MHPAAEPRVLAIGVYTGSGPETTLVEAPVWQQVEGRLLPAGRLERTLDLHTGVLRHLLTSDVGGGEAALFSSLARPGTVAVRLVGSDALVLAEVRGPAAQSVAGAQGGVASATMTRRRDDGLARVERIGAYVTDAERVPRADDAAAALVKIESCVQHLRGPPFATEVGPRTYRGSRRPPPLHPHGRRHNAGKSAEGDVRESSQPPPNPSLLRTPDATASGR
jgi:hypothetical protein